jgi:hypothetical protein
MQRGNPTLKFKPGDIAYIKTTSEKLMIIGQVEHRENRYDVRRPIATRDNGLQHSVESFYEFELEHFDEQLAREFSDMEKVETQRAKLQSNARAAGAVQTSPLVN